MKNFMKGFEKVAISGKMGIKAQVAGLMRRANVHPESPLGQAVSHRTQELLRLPTKSTKQLGSKAKEEVHKLNVETKHNPKAARKQLFDILGGK